MCAGITLYDQFEIICDMSIEFVDLFQPTIVLKSQTIQDQRLLECQTSSSTKSQTQALQETIQQTPIIQTAMLQNQTPHTLQQITPAQQTLNTFPSQQPMQVQALEDGRQQTTQFSPNTVMVSYEQLQSLLTNKTPTHVYSVIQPSTHVSNTQVAVSQIQSPPQQAISTLPIALNSQQAISMLLSSYQQNIAQSGGQPNSTPGQPIAEQLSMLQEQLLNPRRASTGSMPGGEVQTWMSSGEYKDDTKY